jgi:hypothetical protein
MSNTAAVQAVPAPEAKAAVKRLYLVESKQGGKRHLVKASSQAQALRHVVKSHYDVSVAASLDVAAFLTEGGALEDSAED